MCIPAVLLRMARAHGGYESSFSQHKKFRHCWKSKARSIGAVLRKRMRACTLLRRATCHLPSKLHNSQSRAVSSARGFALSGLGLSL